MSLFIRCLNLPTMASHLRALLMLLWWVYILFTFLVVYWTNSLYWANAGNLFQPRFCTKSAIKWSRRAGANRFLPSFQLSRWETCDLLKLYSSFEALAKWFSLNRHHLQLKDLCLNLQNVVHTFAKLRVNIGDFKVTSKHFCTLWPMCWLLKEFWGKLTNLGDPSDWPR